jgi:hypothetical protein
MIVSRYVLSEMNVSLMMAGHSCSSVCLQGCSEPGDSITTCTDREGSGDRCAVGYYALSGDTGCASEYTHIYVHMAKMPLALATSGVQGSVCTSRGVWLMCVCIYTCTFVFSTGSVQVVVDGDNAECTS